jgi:hypothetical protein
MDSALNKWRGQIPDHCTCFCSQLSRVLLTGLQCVGIPRVKTRCSSTSRLRYCARITKFRFCSTVHSFRWLGSLRPQFVLSPIFFRLELRRVQALPSLAACTSAARACATLVDIQRQRTGNVTTILNLMRTFTRMNQLAQPTCIECGIHVRTHLIAEDTEWNAHRHVARLEPRHGACP